MAQDKYLTLPRGHHRLSRDEVGAAQRTRLLLAVVEVVAERGYAATSVGDVLKRAHISRQTFYEHFANKEDCFLAAFDEAADLLIARMQAALGPASDPVLVRMDRVFESYLAGLSAAPELARALLVEVYGAGRAGVARRAAVQERFAVTIADAVTVGQRWRGGLSPHFIGRAVIGAVSALVTARIEAGEAATLPELRGELVELVGALLDPA
ncbi:TetR/AcrR family transcriptional regulator [Catenulispora subtropica]|uniref:TetR/AcrR family transcriptional regulator n=1 Tax=Catenulispora subtropica TaxID=450798 RepID=A0ABP5DQG2_9ACTN